MRSRGKGGRDQGALVSLPVTNDASLQGCVQTHNFPSLSALSLPPHTHTQCGIGGGEVLFPPFREG